MTKENEMPDFKPCDLQEIVNLIDERRYDHDPRADNAIRKLEVIRKIMLSALSKPNDVEFDYKELEISEIDYDPSDEDAVDHTMTAGYFYFDHETPWPYEHGIKNELVLPIEEAVKLKAVLSQGYLSQPKEEWRDIETDLNKCPKCGGKADNGHDRCFPPNPYYCTKCNQTPPSAQQKDK